MKKVKKVSKVSGRFDHKGAPKHIKDVLKALKLNKAQEYIVIVRREGSEDCSACVCCSESFMRKATLTLIEKQTSKSLSPEIQSMIDGIRGVESILGKLKASNTWS